MAASVWTENTSLALEVANQLQVIPHLPKYKPSEKNGQIRWMFLCLSQLAEWSKLHRCCNNYTCLNKSRPTRWHLLYYVNLLLSMFRMLIHPSSEACDYVVRYCVGCIVLTWGVLVLCSGIVCWWCGIRVQAEPLVVQPVILATDQLNAQILVFVIHVSLLHSCTCFEHCCALHQVKLSNHQQPITLHQHQHASSQHITAYTMTHQVVASSWRWMY